VSIDFAQLSRLPLADLAKWLLNLLTNVAVNPPFVNHDQLQNVQFAANFYALEPIKKLVARSSSVKLMTPNVQPELMPFRKKTKIIKNVQRRFVAQKLQLWELPLRELPLLLPQVPLPLLFLLHHKLLPLLNHPVIVNAVLITKISLKLC
jgi:hypothetical protein